MIVVEEFAATVKFSGVFEGTEIEHLRVNRKFNYVVSALRQVTNLEILLVT